MVNIIKHGAGVVKCTWYTYPVCIVLTLHKNASPFYFIIISYFLSSITSTFKCNLRHAVFFGVFQHTQYVRSKERFVQQIHAVSNPVTYLRYYITFVDVYRSVLLCILTVFLSRMCTFL